MTRLEIAVWACGRWGLRIRRGWASACGDCLQKGQALEEGGGGNVWRVLGCLGNRRAFTRCGRSTLRS